MTSTQKVIKYCAIALAIFLIVSIIGGIVGALSSLALLFGDSDVTGEMKSYPITDGVKRLDIEIGSARLEIRTGETFALECNHKYISVKQTGDTLTIHEPTRIGINRSSSASVILTVPEGTVFDRASIVTGAGAVTVDALSANRLSLVLGAGEVRIDFLQAETRAEISGGAGRMTVKGGTLHDLELDMGVGELNLTSRLTGSCDIDQGVGEMNLILLGEKSDYRIDLEKGLGSAILDGMTVSGGIYGNGSSRLDIDGGIGSITISYKPQ